MAEEVRSSGQKLVEANGNGAKQSRTPKQTECLGKVFSENESRGAIFSVVTTRKMALGLFVCGVLSSSTAAFAGGGESAGVQQFSQEQGASAKLSHGSPALADLMSRRVRNAEELIAEGNEIQANAKAFHNKVEILIAQATRLKGEAQVLQSNYSLNAPKLSPTALHAAQSEFRQHLDSFKNNAEAYQAHLQDFRKTLGECHKNQTQFDDFAKRVAIHVDQFHIPIPTIRPPHVCGKLDMTSQEVQHSSAAMAGDMKRVAISEADLQTAQMKLQAAEVVSPGLDNKVQAEALREQKEQALAGEFGKLREEYDLLKTESNILAKNGKGFGSGGQISRATVSGKVRQE